VDHFIGVGRGVADVEDVAGRTASASTVYRIIAPTASA
jgi:hypothetical protein